MVTFTLWQKPPSTLLALTPNTIHIWRAHLDTYVCPHPSVLSTDEKKRAENFKFPIHQNRFTAARTILRHILSQYVNQSPQDLQFEYTSHGKPFLLDACVHFNLSHTNQWALYAISLEEKIGIDIEYMCEDKEVEKIAARFFSEYETRLLSQTPENKKQEMFFRIWTCKEAFIKAIGEGLSFPLKDFEVEVSEETARLVSIYQDKKEAQRWSCIAFNPAQECVATLVVRAPVKEIKLWEGIT